MPATEASVQLKRALTPAAMKPSELARRLGVSHQAVNDWMRGRSLPRPELMGQIEDLLGIPMRAWTRDVESDPEPEVEATTVVEAAAQALRHHADELDGEARKLAKELSVVRGLEKKAGAA